MISFSSTKSSGVFPILWVYVDLRLHILRNLWRFTLTCFYRCIGNTYMRDLNIHKFLYNASPLRWLVADDADEDVVAFSCLYKPPDEKDFWCQEIRFFFDLAKFELKAVLYMKPAVYASIVSFMEYIQQLSSLDNLCRCFCKGIDDIMFMSIQMQLYKFNNASWLLNPQDYILSCTF